MCSMKIEDHWNDVEIYYIEFVVQQRDIQRTITKIVVFDFNSKDKVKELIQKNFKNVVQINFIDNIGDGLHLKNEG